jgi:hypothetical protein
MDFAFFGFLTLDIIILLVIFFAAFFYSYNSGKKYLAKCILSIFPALLIFQSLPFLEGKSDWMKIGAFVLAWLIFYFLLKKNFTSPSTHTGGKRFFDSLLLAIASVFMVLIIYYHVLPISSLYEWKLPFSGFWVQKIPFYVTILIPAVLIFFTNKRDV